MVGCSGGGPPASSRQSQPGRETISTWGGSFIVRAQWTRLISGNPGRGRMPVRRRKRSPRWSATSSKELRPSTLSRERPSSQEMYRVRGSRVRGSSRAKPCISLHRTIPSKPPPEAVQASAHRSWKRSRTAASGAS